MKDRWINIFKKLNLKPQKSFDYLTLSSIIIILLVWVVDLFVPDPLPLIDEVVLPIIAYLISDYYTKRTNKVLPPISDNKSE